jgi:Xaa-Pro dipeptidase
MLKAVIGLFENVVWMLRFRAGSVLPAKHSPIFGIYFTGNYYHFWLNISIQHFNMNETALQLLDAQKKAEALFFESEKRGFYKAGQTEEELNHKIFQLADELFGTRKFWHKRIVRSGENTLYPYDENPPNLLLKQDDIFFLDFGPVFEDWEADFGRTYVLGNDPEKIKLCNDVRLGFEKGKKYFRQNQEITGAELFDFAVKSAAEFGWEFGGEIAGHLIGKFPHLTILGKEIANYVHPDNHEPMNKPDKHGNTRQWIYEIHFVNREKKIGGFYEQLLTIGE